MENNIQSEFHLSDCRFSKNHAQDGGAISNMKQCRLFLKSCSFKNNHASENGGVVHNWFGFTDISDSRFIKNKSESGGSIDNYLGWINVKATRFKRNHVKKYGGAIFNGGMLNSLEDCIFEKNLAPLKGGAIYATKSSSANISNSKFDSNAANGNGGVGGAIYNNSQGAENDEYGSDLSQCVFSYNFATEDGAAIFNNGKLILNECEFKFNETSNNDEALKNEGILSGHKS